MNTPDSPGAEAASSMPLTGAQILASYHPSAELIIHLDAMDKLTNQSEFERSLADSGFRTEIVACIGALSVSDQQKLMSSVRQRQEISATHPVPYSVRAIFYELTERENKGWSEQALSPETDDLSSIKKKHQRYIELCNKQGTESLSAAEVKDRDNLAQIVKTYTDKYGPIV